MLTENDFVSVTRFFGFINEAKVMGGLDPKLTSQEVFSTLGMRPPNNIVKYLMDADIPDWLMESASVIVKEDRRYTCPFIIEKCRGTSPLMVDIYSFKPTDLRPLTRKDFFNIEDIIEYMFRNLLDPSEGESYRKWVGCNLYLPNDFEVYEKYDLLFYLANTIVYNENGAIRMFKYRSNDRVNLGSFK